MYHDDKHDGLISITPEASKRITEMTRQAAVDGGDAATSLLHCLALLFVPCPMRNVRVGVDGEHSLICFAYRDGDDEDPFVFGINPHTSNGVTTWSVNS